MNLHQLRMFAAVVSHEGFSRAAEAVHVSQPAVSKAVSELEHQLDMPLFERGAGQLRLTEAGAVLYDHARTIFGLERAAIADMRSLHELEGGHLTIGASMTIATYLMPPLLARFLDRYPGIDVRIVSDNTEAIQDRLLRYELDLAFVEGPVDDERVDVQHWRDDEMVILANPRHPLLARPVLKPAELSDERWIIREEGSGTRAVTESLLHEAGIEPRRQLEVGSTGAVVESVAAGLGVAMISIEAARDRIASGRVGVLTLPGMKFTRPLYRLGLRRRAHGPAARAFVRIQETER